jgi:hypothetical protein
MKQKYDMYVGAIGFLIKVGTYETDDIKDMDHKVHSGEIDYYFLVE